MKKTILLLLMFISTVIAYADEKQSVAIFDPTSSGTSIDEGTKIAIREIISSTIVNNGTYSIVERTLLEKVMEEQRFSNSGIVDETQATEIGKLAGANKIVLSVITLTGGRNMLSIKLIDVKTARIEKQKVKVVTSGELLDVVEPLTSTLLFTDDDYMPPVSISPSSQPAAAVKDETPAHGLVIKKEGGRLNWVNDFVIGMGNLTFLDDVQSLNVVIDVEKPYIEGIPYDEYINSLGYMEKGKFTMSPAPLKMDFLEAANKETNRISYRISPDAKYSVLVALIEVDRQVQEAVCDFYFYETKTSKMLCMATGKVKNKGGLPLLKKKGDNGSLNWAFSAFGNMLAKEVNDANKNAKKAEKKEDKKKAGPSGAEKSAAVSYEFNDVYPQKSGRMSMIKDYVLTYGSVAPLLGQSSVNVVIAPITPIVEGLPFNEYILTKNGQKNANFLDEYIAENVNMKLAFIGNANKETKYFTYNVKPTDEYTLVVIFDEVNKDGSECVVDYVFCETLTKEVTAVISSRVKGGKKGLFVKLMEDVFKDHSEDFVKFMNNELKHVSRRR